MESNPDIRELELLCLVVNFGIGSKVLRIAKHAGVTGGTIFLGKGTVKNRLLELLDLNDVRKEIVLMIAPKTIADHALEELDKELSLHKPNHGIAFTIPVRTLIGARNWDAYNVKESRGRENIMYNAIFVVVEKGKSEEVVEAATQAGARGATVIYGRGAGLHETSTLFSMAIEPEKDIVMILSASDITDSIVSKINEHLEIEKPGHGILFVLDVTKTYGLR